MKSIENIQEGTAKKFSLLAGCTAFILAAMTLPLYLKGAGELILLDAAISILCGVGIIVGNRLAAVTLLAFTLASRYGAFLLSGGGWINLFLNICILISYSLGVIGTFARDRLRRAAEGEQCADWMDTGIAVLFRRIAGSAGLGFGLLIAWFSATAEGEFSLFNLVDSLLILLFAWQTLKGRYWAAALQLLLCLASMLLSYARSGDVHSIFGFIPLFMLEIYILGFIGVAKIRTGGTPNP